MPLSLIIALAVFGGCVLIAAVFGHHYGNSEVEQSVPREDPSSVAQGKRGRFQVVAVESGLAQSERLSVIVVCDTATGQCWACDWEKGGWSNLDRPSAAGHASGSQGDVVNPPHRRETADVA